MPPVHGVRRFKFLLGLFPSLVLLFCMTLVPTVSVWVIAFYGWTLGSSPRLVGLRNFSRLTSDDYFLKAALVTFIFVLTASTLEIFGGFLIAGAMNFWPRLRNSFRAVLALPLVISPMLAGLIWRLGLDEQAGLITRLAYKLFSLHIYPLSSQNGAMLSIVCVDFWQWMPFVAIVVSLAWERAEERLVDVVNVDGILPRTAFRFVWWPLLLPTLGLASLLRIIDCLRLFDLVAAVTAGGPGNATETLPLFIYKQIVRFGNFGYAAAAAVILLLVSSLVWIIGDRLLLSRLRLG